VTKIGYNYAVLRVACVIMVVCILGRRGYVCRSHHPGDETTAVDQTRSNFAKIALSLILVPSIIGIIEDLMKTRGLTREVYKADANMLAG
jgi:hypothetical protein